MHYLQVFSLIFSLIFLLGFKHVFGMLYYGPTTLHNMSHVVHVLLKWAQVVCRWRCASSGVRAAMCRRQCVGGNVQAAMCGQQCAGVGVQAAMCKPDGAFQVSMLSRG